MGKKDKKEKQRKKQQSAGGDDEYRGSGGLLTSMRGGFKSVAGTGGAASKRTGLKRLGDALFWVVILAMAVLVFYRFGR